MQREFRESAVKVPRFPRVNRARVCIGALRLKCTRICTDDLELSKRHAIEIGNRFDAVCWRPAGVLRYR